MYMRPLSAFARIVNAYDKALQILEESNSPHVGMVREVIARLKAKME